MALYVSRAQRTRRTVILVAAAALVAFGLGWAYGRQQVPSIDDRVAEVRAEATDAATSIERLDIEYEQAVSGGDTVQAGVLEPLDDLRVSLQEEMDRAPWITVAQRAAL